MFDKTRAFVKKLGLPEGDLYSLPTSTKKFPDGAHYRLEVPTVNTAEAMKALMEEATRLGITINRVDETYGCFRHTLAELKEYVAIAKEYKVELNLSVGPRATYDTSATRLSEQGVRISYRLRGMEQVVRAVEDVKRIAEVGGRGVLVYDEGLLWVLNEMRKAGELPKNMHFKLSGHVGHGNPASFKMLQDLGADSINPVRDLTLPMIAALRATVDVPLDVHTDNPPGSGGFIRVYEAPEMVRIGAPIHLKTGNSVVAGHGQLTTAQNGRDMARQAAIVKEMLERYYPEAIQSKAGTPDMALPE
ncbi:hypothetical protein [Acetomicrobium sp. UBA5826]|uniref:hypothetical protein n=1 Tax=Acetomicrobium sp. UBA5826 TaxID=1946039 RepID=UPI00257EEA49|nr:hypothetical protein [Acetomicrobium sp. UBA5826]